MSTLWRAIMVQMFMRDLKKVSALRSVRFRVSTLERFSYKAFLRNSSGIKFFVRLREVSALEDVRYRAIPLYFRTTVEICNVMQCYQWKTFEYLFEYLDLNCISIFRDFDTILPIFTHIFVYHLVAKWQLKLTCLVILVKLLLEKESRNRI